MNHVKNLYWLENFSSGFQMNAHNPTLILLCFTISEHTSSEYMLTIIYIWKGLYWYSYLFFNSANASYAHMAGVSWPPLKCAKQFCAMFLQSLRVHIQIFWALGTLLKIFDSSRNIQNSMPDLDQTLKPLFTGLLIL